MEKVVANRKVCHKAWRQSKSAEDKHNLDVAKKVYTAVVTAQESKLQEFTADHKSESGRKNCFRNVVSDADGMKNIWRKYMEIYI